MTDKQEYVLLRVKEVVVGTGQLFCGEDEGPRRTLHGHDLKDLQKDGEDLVVLWNVVIFSEFEHLEYPYTYGCFEGPPLLLGDLNEAKKYFKALTAWDYNYLTPSSFGFKLRTYPRQISRDELKQSEFHKIKRVRFADLVEEDVSVDGNNEFRDEQNTSDVHPEEFSGHTSSSDDEEDMSNVLQGQQEKETERNEILNKESERSCSEGGSQTPTGTL